jgi:predicted RNA-binding protein with PUA-like domain
MQYWLMKTEPSEYDIDDLMELPNQTIEWFGVRNYQARNYMRDEMKLGDLVIFWHSSCKEPGIYGIVKVSSPAHPDSHQFDVASHYYDPTSTLDNPRWQCVDVQFVKKTRYVSITELRQYPELADMQVLKRGNRLSVTKVTTREWDFIQTLI